MDQGGFCMWSEGKRLYGCNTKEKMGINVCCQVSGPVPVTAIQVPCQHNMEMNSENKMKGENLSYVMYMHIWS